jgi:hypothetical protein
VKKLPKFDDQNIDLPFGVPVQMGLVDNFSGIQKFGYNSSVGSSFETVWDGGGDYTFITSAGTATATSSNTSSDNGGTVKVFGLDSNYDLAEETLTIGGSASTTSFIRIFRALMLNANTGNANVGTITITVSSTTIAQIQPTYGQTLMSVYTTPRNYRGYLLQLDVGSSKDLENEIIFRIKGIDNGNAWNTRSFITTRGGFVEKTFHIPEIILPKTDIEVRAKSSATSSISSSFELLLQDISLSG